VRPRLTGLLGGVATACALALAACGDEKTDQTDVRRVSAAARRDGNTGTLSVLLDLEGGTAFDSVVDIRFWDSRRNAARYLTDVGGGPLGDLHHEQLGTATITYAHHEHGAEEHEMHSDVRAVAACAA
jgi:hypothetical protein